MRCRSPAPGPGSRPTISAWMSRSASPRTSLSRNRAAPPPLRFEDRVWSRKRRADPRAPPRPRSAPPVKVRVGYEIAYDCPKPTPMLLVLSVHPSRQSDLLSPQRIVFNPPIASTDYHDAFGNVCTRILAPVG